jgi:membrane protein
MKESLLKYIRKIIRKTQRITLPGFDGIPIYNVAQFFLKEVFKGDIRIRAQAIAFSFFLAIFPSIIFLFTLIPYVPIEGFQHQLLDLIRSLLPYNTYEAAQQTIDEIITRQNGGLLSFGFLFALFVSTNGVNSLIEGFNKTTQHVKKRKGFKQRLIAIYLTLLLAVLVIIAILLIIVTEIALHYISNHLINLSKSSVYLLLTGKYLVLLLLSFTAISSIYFFGPSGGRKKWRFFSPGSILATFLIAITSIVFNYFIQHFGQYNKVYGSIGTLMIILIYINFNCMQLLIGFELNNAIEKAKLKPITKIFESGI